MDGLESHLNNRINELGYVDGVSLQAQMAVLKADVATLADKPVTLPPPLVPDSLMNLFTMPPVTQPVGDIWVDLDRPKIGKGKEKKKTSDTSLPDETPREEHRRLKKARNESK
uniref:Integrase core domain containing protein n=1 Tax=Solanum tuberosum TaxID=4113 RepID=M1DTD8_SOLTU